MTTTAPAWIGWIEVDLCPYAPMDEPVSADRPAPSRGTGAALVTMDVSVRMDIVLFWIGSTSPCSAELKDGQRELVGLSASVSGVGPGVRGEGT